MAKINLKKYSLGEELVSAISHGIGAILAIVATVFAIIKAVSIGNPITIISISVFCFSLINLYLMSTIYHSLAINNGKRVFRVLDHCSIFLLIAGTYTPYSLLCLKGWVGWSIFAVVWIAAIVGIILNSIDLKKYKIFSMICYLLMGWVIVLAFKPLMDALMLKGLILLIAGGIAYSVGAIIYAIGGKRKYFHSIWHFFVLIGSILHFLSIYFYVL